MNALSPALILSALAALSPPDLDRAARAFALAHPEARLVAAANGGLEHASGLAVARVETDAEANARAFLQAEGTAFGVTSERDLRTLRVWSAGSGGTAVFERSVDGRPVFGGRVVIGWRADGAITVVNGARVLAANARGRFVASAAQALAAALASVDGRPGAAAVADGWLQFEGALWPVYRVEHDTADPIDSFVTYVDAETGNVLYQIARRRSAVALPPCGPCLAPPCVCTYRDSPIMPPPGSGALVNEPEPLPARELDPPGDRLNGRRTAAYGCLGAEATLATCTVQAARLDSGAFLAAPDATMRRTDDAFAEQSAYFHIDDHSRFLDSLDAACLATPAAPGAAPRCFGERTPAGGIGFIPGFVNAFSKGQPLQNAFFSPSGGPAGASGVMIFGQAPLVDLAYDAEIVYHELTHAAVDVTSNFEEFTDRFGANPDPGSLNEGTADAFAAAHTAETLAATGDITPAACLFSYFAASIGERCLRDAANLRTCLGNGPNDGRDPGRTGEVHDDGEIWSGFTWSLLQAADRHALRAQVASALFRALETVGPHPTFLGYAATVRQSMSDAGLPQDALDFVDCTIEQRDLAGCSERSVALYSGERAQGGFFGPPSSGTTAAGQQYFVDLPCEAVALHLQAGDSLGTGVLYVRKGSPIEFADPSLASPTYDWVLPANRVEALLDARGCPACACSGARAAFGGGRWYFLPSGQAKDAGGNTNTFELAVTIEMPAGQEPPRRVAYSFTPEPSVATAPNRCVWGAGPVPQNRVFRTTSAPPPPGACAAAAANAALACGDVGAGNGGRCGCSTLGPDGGLLLVGALVALRLRRRRRTPPLA